MSEQVVPRLSVSTWSLHRALGVAFADAPGYEGARDRRETWGAGSVALLDVPARLAAMGIHTMEICHFQMPSRDASYLNELRSALSESKVHLLSLLIDDGDITHPDYAARDRAWISGWIETAGDLGAERARVIAGKAEYSPEALAASKAALKQLAEQASARNVRVTTENWYALLAQPAAVLELLDSLEGKVGLNVDFGNWGGPNKYEDLAAIFPRGESCHAKCAFDENDVPNSADFNRCIDLGRAVGFTGPFTLIYDGPNDDEWAMLRVEQKLVNQAFAAPTA